MIWERWRHFARRRELGSWLLVLAAIGLLAGAAWISRHPESPWLERATRCPLVGPAAAALRARLLPPPPPSAPEPPPEPIVIWIPFGETTASPAARPLEAPEPTPRTFEVSPPRDVATANTESLAPPLGRGVEPTLPLPGRPPDADRLERALTELRGSIRERRIGPYPLLTDVEETALLDRASRVAEELEPLYSARYGRKPLGEARESVVLFADEASYRAVQREELELAHVAEATGHAGHGLVALYQGGRSDDEVLGTLVHELTHLLTRRAIGPALPPWLDEGIAEDLAMSRIDAEGHLLADTFSRIVRRRGNEIALSGGEAALRSLADGDGGESWSGHLERLLELDRDGFVRAPDVARSYATSACWVRFLMAEPALRARFLAFLSDVAAGAPSSREELLFALGRPREELEEELERWVKSGIAGLPPLD